ncbi:transcription regulator [Pedobacter sp. BAL39]|uniref:AraC family transcriptional regulator n=1 Tax=Pedobacter sp. BAL39 TaxID=391596 RepID=UPI000155A2A4|nr:helix-turn-helix domain-containing protein [Pedobacter sp. BAL39]EDM34298.1 transcription regulator [Pedobacter sp. BAL39]
MMAQERQFDSLVITAQEVTHVEKHLHIHNYYQFIFIKSGRGKHHLNGEVMTFGPGDLFFVSPQDEHSFEIDTVSELINVRFSEYGKGKLKTLQKAWTEEFAGLKKGRSLLNIKVTFSAQDLLVVERIFELLALLKDEVQHNEAVIYIQLIALVSLIERNLSYGTGTIAELKVAPDRRKSVELLLSYINRHISQPEKLSAAALAAKHGLSVHYIGLYFKQHLGMNLQAYINECRQTIIARKLLQGSASIAELAAEFNFTDVSHFNKRFKQHWGLSPRQYRLSRLRSPEPDLQIL